MEKTPPSGPPFLSVVIPTRHRNDLLAQCLVRLAPGQQTGLTLHSPAHAPDAAPTYEVLVTDDGSVTSAEALVRSNFPWARWLKGPRQGPAANRNHGARHAVGEWLVFTDDDCLPAEDWLQAYAGQAQASAGSEVLEGRTTTGGVPCGPFESAPVNETGGFLWSCNFAIRRPLFESLHGFDEAFRHAHMEDVDLRARLAQRSVQPRFVPEALVVHPPRPVLTLRQHAQYEGANVYFARKHGRSLRAEGFGLLYTLQVCARHLKACRTFREVVRYSLRDLAWVLMRAVLLPVWMWRYRGTPRTSPPV